MQYLFWSQNNGLQEFQPMLNLLCSCVFFNNEWTRPFPSSLLPLSIEAVCLIEANGQSLPLPYIKKLENGIIIRTPSPIVHWHHLVQFTKSIPIPRHCFILWLAIKCSLRIKDKIISWGFQISPTCLLCQIDNESLSHLFLAAAFQDHFGSKFSLCVAF